jgi:hypothetical protein
MISVIDEKIFLRNFYSDWTTKWCFCRKAVDRDWTVVYSSYRVTVAREIKPMDYGRGARSNNCLISRYGNYQGIMRRVWRIKYG